CPRRFMDRSSKTSAAPGALNTRAAPRSAAPRTRSALLRCHARSTGLTTRSTSWCRPGRRQAWLHQLLGRRSGGPTRWTPTCCVAWINRGVMGREFITGAVRRTARELLPVKLVRFLVSTVVPGTYARDIRWLHRQAERDCDETTLHVPASVALWQRTMANPTCLHEAEAVPRAFFEQTMSSWRMRSIRMQALWQEC